PSRTIWSGKRLRSRRRGFFRHAHAAGRGGAAAPSCHSAPEYSAAGGTREVVCQLPLRPAVVVGAIGILCSAKRRRGRGEAGGAGGIGIAGSRARRQVSRAPNGRT